MLRVRPRDPVLSPGVVEYPAGVVEDLADLGAGSARAARAASMSSTTSCRPCVEPGAAVVTPVPKMIAPAEPGGVSCTTRKSGPGEKSASSRHPSPR